MISFDISKVEEELKVPKIKTLTVFYSSFFFLQILDTEINMMKLRDTNTDKNPRFCFCIKC